MTTTDIIGRTVEALISIVDRASSITTLTGRASSNILPSDDDSEQTPPVLYYDVVSSDFAGGIGDTRSVVVDVTAAADTRSAVNDLLGAVEALLTAPNFTSTGLSACVLRVVRRDVGSDSVAGAAVRLGLAEFTILVTN